MWKIMMLAAVLITLPAIAALIWGLLTGNGFLIAAAAASFGMNSIPFVAAGFLLRGREAAGH